MNDKQKEIALKMAVVRARMSMDYINAKAFDKLKEELYGLLAAFDAAADPKPRPLTVEDIEKPQLMRKVHGDFWYIRCGDYDWTSDGWFRQTEGSSGYPKHVADVLYAGLVATKTLPPQEDA